MEEEFDFRRFVREIIAESAEEQVDALADEVNAQTPLDLLREAFRQMLPAIIREEMARAPRAWYTGDTLTETPVESTTAINGGIATSSPKEDDVPRDVPVAGNSNERNSRVARLRRARFNVNVHIAAGTYRNILDCTADQLLYAAVERDVVAQRNATAANRYRQLAKLMADRGADTVSDLSDREIDGLIEDLVPGEDDDG